MRLIIDGDAFPNLLKPIIIKAINKKMVKTIVVSNKKINLGDSVFIEYVLVSLGMDKADTHIVELLEDGDLIITADIPLADKVISKNGKALGHRGECYSKDNIKQYLTMRNLMEQIRDSGEKTKGPTPFTKKDCEVFANGLYSLL